MIPVCSEAEIVGCVHEAVAIHHLHTLRCHCSDAEKPRTHAAVVWRASCHSTLVAESMCSLAAHVVKLILGGHAVKHAGEEGLLRLTAGCALPLQESLVYAQGHPAFGRMAGRSIGMSHWIANGR